MDSKVSKRWWKIIQYNSSISDFYLGGAFAYKIFSRRYVFLGFGLSPLRDTKIKALLIFSGHARWAKGICPGASKGWMSPSGRDLVLGVVLIDIMGQKPKSYSFFGIMFTILCLDLNIVPSEFFLLDSSFSMSYPSYSPAPFVLIRIYFTKILLLIVCRIGSVVLVWDILWNWN